MRTAITASAFLAITSATVKAQTVVTDTLPYHPVRTSPLLPDNHWALDALLSAQSLGLLDDYVPAARAVTRSTAGEAFARATANADVRDRGLAELARGWQSRFHREFPEVAEVPDVSSASRLRMLGSSISAGYEKWSARVAPGQAQFPPDRTGAIPLPRVDHPRASVSIAAAASFFAFELNSKLSGGDLELSIADASAGWRRWMLSFGRRPVSYGMTGSESVLLSGGVSLDRIQLETRGPLRAGGPVRHLGPISLHTFLARLPEERHPGRPYFWGARVSSQPHPRLTLSIQRAAMFGGDEATEAVTFRRLLLLLIGSVEGATFENQLISASARYRLPTDSVLSLTAYSEVGAEDASGAWWDVPGFTVGIVAPTLPGTRKAGVGLEYTRFGPSCCGNPPWYRHFGFPGNWSGPDLPLGHPLGGEGREIHLYSHALLAGSRLRVEGHGVLRSRRGENLYVPGREGDSLGARATAQLQLSATTDLAGSFGIESGNGWAERRLEIGGTLYFAGER